MTKTKKIFKTRDKVKALSTARSLQVFGAEAPTPSAPVHPDLVPGPPPYYRQDPEISFVFDDITATGILILRSFFLDLNALFLRSKNCIVLLVLALPLLAMTLPIS